MKTDNMLAGPMPGGANPVDDRIWEGDSSPGRGTLTVSALLRGLGGLVIVAAFLMYLFQGWRDGDDLARTLILLAHTGVLTLAGFASGHWLKETKGARLLIALALAAVPINFAFLGGITYDHLTWDQVQAQTPVFAQGQGLWRPVLGGGLDGASAIGLAAGAILVLAVAIWIGFLVMARRSAWSLAGLYLLANTALLVPTRGQAAISVMLLILAVALALLTFGLRRRDPSLATPEGVFARAVLVLPLMVLGGRSIWLYAPDGLFYTSMALLGYLGLRLAVGASAGRRRWLLEWAAVLLAGISAVLAFSTTESLRGLADVWVIPISTALFAGLMLDLALVVDGHATRYRIAAALTLAVGLSANLAAFGGLGNAAACVLLGLAGVVWAYSARLRSVFAAGLITTLLGLGVGGHQALASFTIGGWTGLVLAGIATIAAGSVVERHGERIKAGLTRWNRRFESAD